jgi:two-component system, chemotaxis family, protein-glutamate methylesterase/glutaminase
VTRVLLIDDSVLVRRMVSRALAREPAVEVVGAMSNGHAAVLRAEVLRPDVVLLDSEVAGSDGCATLAELKRRRPDVRAVMRGDASGLTEERVKLTLLPAIRGLACPPAPRRAVGAGKQDPARPVEAVVVAASTGGPDALELLLTRLPGQLRFPILVVQHMPAEFTKLLADRLNRRSTLSVLEATHGEPVSAGRVYVAPGGSHMEVERVHRRVTVVLRDSPPENSCRPAADVLFRSAAALYGANLLAVVLTGMGRDGLLGAEAVRAAGGSVIAQSEGSSVIASMPGAVASAGLANAVMDVDDMSEALIRYGEPGARR